MMGRFTDTSTTLDQVRAVFENLTADFNNDYDGICLLTDCDNVGIVQYLFRKSVNMDPQKRAVDIRCILKSKFIDFRNNNCKLVPGEPAYEIVLMCLEEIKADGYSKLDPQIDYDMRTLIIEGKIELLIKFLEAGFKLPMAISPIQNIKENNSEMIRFLINHGLQISDECFSIQLLMECHEVTVSDFEFYLQKGMPLDYDFAGQNWLELALGTNNLDIAFLLYNKGLRLEKRRLQSVSYYGQIIVNIDILVKRVAVQTAFNEVIKIICAGKQDGGSILAHIPMELIYEMAKPLCSLYEVAIGKELIR